MNSKRVVIATLFGLAAGVLCGTGGFLSGLIQFTAVNAVWVLLNRGVMGFAIGISGLRIGWAWNGIIVGLVVGSIFSYSMFMTMGPSWIPLVNALVNALFGLGIEFCTTVLCRQRAAAASLAAA
jgi:hypothetical protein